MNILILYLLLLKATITSFSGLASLPIVRNDLVVHRQVLTDTQLNTAVALGRSTPGPAGLYIVSVGYFIAGIPGAIAGWLALISPALLIIPMLRFLGERTQSPRVRSALDAVIVAGAGLVLATTVPLAAEVVSGVILTSVALLSFLLLVTTRLNVLWVILGAASISLAADAIRLIIAAH